MSTEREISYGGVVVRGDEVIVIVPRGRRRVLGAAQGRRERRARRREQTAAREVREETGVTAHVRERLGEVDYWLPPRRPAGRQDRPLLPLRVRRRGHRRPRPRGRRRALDAARARPARALSYPGEREMIERALSILAANGRVPPRCRS